MFSSSANPSTPAAAFFTSKNTRPMACRAAATNGTDYYKLLSVSSGRDASGEEIKRAYRAMALQYHPDCVCDPVLKEQCTRMFVQLNAAYETLSDPVLRREYDQSVMNSNIQRHSRAGFDFDRAAWQWQLLELQRRSALQRDRSTRSWGGRMRAQNAAV